MNQPRQEKKGQVCIRLGTRKLKMRKAETKKTSRRVCRSKKKNIEVGQQVTAQEEGMHGVGTDGQWRGTGPLSKRNNVEVAARGVQAPPSLPSAGALQ